MDNPEKPGRKSPEKGVDPPEDDENANPPAAQDRSPAVEPDRGAAEPGRGAVDVPSTSNVGAIGGLPVVASGSGACGVESLPLVARNPLLTKMLTQKGGVPSGAGPPDETAAKRLKYSPSEEHEGLVQNSPEDDEEEGMDDEDEEEDEEDMEDDGEMHRRLILEDRSPPQPESDDESLNRKL